MQKKHILAVLISAVLAIAALVNANTRSRLKEGWRKSVLVTHPILGKGDRYVVWVENGWLHTKRETKSQETDWYVVLARAVDPEPPKVAAGDGILSFSLSYHGGRYFIREDLNNVRGVRQRKTRKEGTRYRHQLVDERYEAAGHAGSEDPVVSGWRSSDWFVITSGPELDRVDCMIRLKPMDSDASYLSSTNCRRP